jgi:hypothetical protein
MIFSIGLLLLSSLFYAYFWEEEYGKRETSSVKKILE